MSLEVCVIAVLALLIGVLAWVVIGGVIDKRRHTREIARIRAESRAAYAAWCAAQGRPQRPPTVSPQLSIEEQP